MDVIEISQMATLIKKACVAANLDPGKVMTGPTSVGIIGSGIDAVLVLHARGRGRHGWELRSTFVSTPLGATTSRNVTEVVGAFALEDTFQVALQAVMIVVQMRVIEALGA